MPSDVNDWNDFDLVSIISKEDDKEFVKDYLIRYIQFPRGCVLSRLEKDIETAVEQCKIVIPIITQTITNYEHNKGFYEILKKVKDKKIYCCIHDSSIADILIEFPEDYKYILEDGLVFEEKRDLISKISREFLIKEDKIAVYSNKT